MKRIAGLKKTVISFSKKKYFSVKYIEKEQKNLILNSSHSDFSVFLFKFRDT